VDLKENKTNPGKKKKKKGKEKRTRMTSTMRHGCVCVCGQGLSPRLRNTWSVQSKLSNGNDNDCEQRGFENAVFGLQT
jgi:hypothetical protein